MKLGELIYGEDLHSFVNGYVNVGVKCISIKGTG